jgi:hypothetical protein
VKINEFDQLYRLEAKSDVNETQEDESNIDGESDTETTTPSDAMATETDASLIQGNCSFLHLDISVMNSICLCLVQDHPTYFYWRR